MMLADSLLRSTSPTTMVTPALKSRTGNESNNFVGASGKGTFMGTITLKRHSAETSRARMRRTPNLMVLGNTADTAFTSNREREDRRGSRTD